MCGRFSLSGEIDFYADYFGTNQLGSGAETVKPSWNVAPTDPVYVVAEREGARRLEVMRWGLTPHWATNGRSMHINARSETVATSSTFRDSFIRKRCLIAADGFYEWEERGGTPHWIFRADGFPLGFAGLWATWRNPADGEWVRSCAIVTTAATGVIASLHDRMPVALSPAVWEAWLDRDLKDPHEASALLQPIADDLWMERPVSKLVGSVKNNGPRLQDPDPQTRLL